MNSISIEFSILSNTGVATSILSYAALTLLCDIHIDVLERVWFGQVFYYEGAFFLF